MHADSYHQVFLPRCFVPTAHIRLHFREAEVRKCEAEADVNTLVRIIIRVSIQYLRLKIRVMFKVMVWIRDWI